jgi:lipopolysaccharide biosynthesis glycosyltransferase
MTRVAVASLRLSNSKHRVIIACDRQSDLSMRKACDPLIDEVDEWMVVETPLGEAMFRNRYVKTRLRSLLEGPFLFLDSDVLVRRDLCEIFMLDCDIAGARNHSRADFSEQLWDQDLRILDAMGWEVKDDIYLNGGVLFYNDTESAREFATEWHRRWIESVNVENCFRDQPALNSALHVTRPRLKVLSDRFNAQIKTEPKAALDAVIWHYYSSVKNPVITAYDLLIKKVLNGSKIEFNLIREMIQCPHPWRNENFIDTWVAKKIMQKGKYKNWEKAWLNREIRKFVFKRIDQKFNRIKLKFFL